MNIIFQINGGIGKCIVATAVCSAIKKNYPEASLIVLSGYPEVFLNNPNVYRNFKFGETSYFFKEFIENKEYKLFIQEPYVAETFFKEEKHLVEIWCDLFGLKFDNEYPQLFLTKKEIQAVQQQVKFDKPIMLLQTNGGADLNKKYGWARDLPSCNVAEIIEEFKKTHAIFHVRREDQISYQDTISLTTNLRQICAVALMSEKRLCIDSFLQHALGALGLPAVVCWIVNSPIVYGYKIHTNIYANSRTVNPDLRHAMYSEFDFTGNELEFPYEDETEIFNSSEIIETLKTYKNKV